MRFENRNNSSDDGVAEVLRSLSRVEAPGDFEAKVRARIARGETGVRSTFWLRPVSYVLPAFLVVASATTAAFYFSSTNETGFSSTGAIQPATDEVAPIVPPAPAVPAIVVPSARSAAVPSVPIVATGRPAPRATNIPVGSKSSPEPRSFVRDSAVKRAKDPILVRDVDPTTGRISDQKVDDFQSSGSVEVGELLRMMGVDGEKVEAGWKVRSAAAGSSAERSGIKTGDIIEAVDEKPLSGANTIGDLSFNSVQVVREGKRVRLQIRNK